ncbi:FtsW/RodA/SpoVE family cell cycle protein [Escherichia coli]
MMERKIGQIAMGLVIMVVMAQIPPRVYEGGPPSLHHLYYLLVAVDAFGAISKGAQRWLDLGIVRSAVGNCQNSRTTDGRALYHRDVCPPSLKNTGIALAPYPCPRCLAGRTA